MSPVGITIALVLAALIGGGVTFFFFRKRAEESASQPDANASGIAEELVSIGGQIERALAEQRVQGETQRQLLIQKLDDVRHSVDSQQSQVEGLRNELRHEIQRRDHELAQVRNQLGSLTGAAPPMEALPPAGGSEAPHTAQDARASEDDRISSSPVFEEMPMQGSPVQDATFADITFEDATPAGGFSEAPSDDVRVQDHSFEQEAAAPIQSAAMETQPYGDAPYAQTPYGEPAGEGEPAPLAAADASTSNPFASDTFGDVSFDEIRAEAMPPAPDASIPAGTAEPADTAMGPVPDTQEPAFVESFSQSFAPPPRVEIEADDTPAEETSASEVSDSRPLFEEVAFGDASASDEAPTDIARGDGAISSDIFESWNPVAKPSEAAPIPEAEVAPQDAAAAHDTAAPRTVPDSPAEPTPIGEPAAPAFAAAPSLSTQDLAEAPTAESPVQVEAPALRRTSAPEMAPEDKPAEPAPPADSAWVARPYEFAPQAMNVSDLIPSKAAKAKTPAAPNPSDGLIDLDAMASAPEQVPAAPPAEAGADPAGDPQPAPMAAPEGADDLTIVSTIDADTQRLLYEAGVTTLEQIAQWSPSDARRMSGTVSVSETTIMNQWVFEAQAALFNQYAQRASR